MLDDLEDELAMLRDVVASTKKVGLEYAADLRLRGFGDIADVLDGSLEIIDRLSELLVHQDAVIQKMAMRPPTKPLPPRSRVH